jgi:DNA-binding GntR family transcriptional regulator
MAFHVSLVGRKNLSGEIYRQIRRAILDGRLRPGDRLSPSRDLARALAISRMTVIVAYQRLASEGSVTSRLGAGTFVSDRVRAMIRPIGSRHVGIPDASVEPTVTQGRSARGRSLLLPR